MVGSECPNNLVYQCMRDPANAWRRQHWRCDDCDESSPDEDDVGVDHDPTPSTARVHRIPRRWGVALRFQRLVRLNTERHGTSPERHQFLRMLRYGRPLPGGLSLWSGPGNRRIRG